MLSYSFYQDSGKEDKIYKWIYERVKGTEDAISSEPPCPIYSGTINSFV